LGEFNLREFASNHTAAMKQLAVDDRITGMWSGEKIKVLGLSWDTFADTLIIKMPEPVKDGELTMRKILSNIASVFDPLGLVSPTMLEAKIFLQSLWDNEGKEEKVPREKLWDQQMTQALLQFVKKGVFAG
jgi:hypothetical protein